MSKFEEFKKDRIKVYTKDKRQQNLNENMDLFVFRNIKRLCMGSVELINNTLFHGLDTLKVRVQAKCKLHDISLFFKNKVETKRIFILN